MTLAEALKAYKQNSGRTYRSIAEELGISISFLYNLVNNDRLPKKREDVQRLATMLDVSTDYVDFLCGRVPPDIIDHLTTDYYEVERIREGMR